MHSLFENQLNTNIIITFTSILFPIRFHSFFPVLDINPYLIFFFSICLPVLDIELPNNVLLECNSADDCPTSRGQCNTMLTANPSGSSGQCVPLNCQTDTDCPTIGDECQDGALFGQCNSAYTCDYSKVLGFGNCQGKKSL